MEKSHFSCHLVVAVALTLTLTRTFLQKSSRNLGPVNNIS
jgi:hypothetical protein